MGRKNEAQRKERSRGFLSVTLLGIFVVVGFTVPVGTRTLFSHVKNIWAGDETQELVDGVSGEAHELSDKTQELVKDVKGSDEAQELVEGVKEGSGRVMQRVRRGVKAGIADEDSAKPDPTSPRPDASDTSITPAQ